MKILLVNDYAGDTGGAELHMRGLRSQLHARGHDARLFTSTALLRPGDEPPDYACFGTASRFRTLLQTANPWASSRLSDAIDEFKPDLVHVMMFLTQLSPLILRCSVECPPLNVVWIDPYARPERKCSRRLAMRSSWGWRAYKNSASPRATGPR